MNSNRTLLATYLLILFAHITLIWTLKYVPTQDGPSHIYNLEILQDLLQGGEIWDTHYTHELQLVPNLGFHIFAYPLTAFLTPWQTEKAFLSIYIFLMGLSVPVLLKAFQRPVFPACFLVFPVIFNFTLLMGFYSYCVAVPFFILSFSLAWSIRNKAFLLKISIYSICGLFLFCLHLVPFVFYMVGLFSISISDYFKKNMNIRILFQNLAAIAPLIILFCYYLLNYSQQTYFSYEYLFSLKRLALLFTDLASFSTFNYTLSHFIPSALFSAIVWVLILISIKDKLADKQHKYVIYSPYFMTAFVLSLIYFLFPFSFAGGSFFNERFPWVIFLLLLPLIRIPTINFFSRYASVIIVSSIIFVFMSNAAFIWKHSFLVEDFMKGLHLRMPQNSIVMHFKKPGLNTSRADVLLHAVSHYAITHNLVNAANYEARMKYFPVRFREDLPPFPPVTSIKLSPWDIEWNLYPDINFLVAWEIKQDEQQYIGQFFDISFEEGSLSIWQRTQNEESNAVLYWEKNYKESFPSLCNDSIKK